MRLNSVMTTMCICFCLSLSSCIQDEAPNAEADILTCTVSDPSILKMDPIITNNTVIIMAQSSADIEHLALSFSLTDGATIEPKSGTERDFSEIQSYTVTSQDKKWQKRYKILVSTANINTNFSFEHWETIEGSRGKEWHGFYEVSDDGQKQSIWATANAGYALTGYVTPEGEKLTNPLIYPTVSNEIGYMGKGVKLETKATGAFGDMLKMPLAAGNLFIGSFDPSVAGNGPKEALKATLFGIPISYNDKPIAFETWYKYTPGPIFTDENKNIVENQTDIFDIYAIIYELKDGRRLDGSIQFDDDCIIALARVENPQPNTEYKKLSIPFKYLKNIDHDKLVKGDYYTAVVFSSSRDGAYFRGAIGSILIVDEAKLIFEEDQ